MEEGIIISCLVKVGQKVKKGDFLFEIETDKATIQMESPEEGFVKEILVKQGQTLPVGQILLILGEENEKTNMEKNVSKKTDTSVPIPKIPAEKITQADINAAMQGRSNYKLGQKVLLSKLAKTTAEKMLQSNREIPCFYLNVTVDTTELAVFGEKLNKSTGFKISFDDFLMKALALGLKQWPVMTGRLESAGGCLTAGDSIQLADSIGIGLRLASPRQVCL